MEFIIRFLIIFLARVSDVSLDTVRIILLTKGQKIYAAMIGFVEICIYILALRYVMSCLNQSVYFVFAYAGGFASGNLLGSYMEGKLPFGHLTAQIVSSNGWRKLAENLRKKDFGVTTINGEGLKGPKVILNVIFARQKLKELNDIVEQSDHSAFVTIFDAKKIKGGYFF